MKKNISTIISISLLVLIPALIFFERKSHGEKMYKQGVNDGIAATVKRTNFLIDSTLGVKDAFYFSKIDTVSIEKNTYIH